MGFGPDARRFFRVRGPRHLSIVLEQSTSREFGDLEERPALGPSALNPKPILDSLCSRAFLITPFDLSTSAFDHPAANPLCPQLSPLSNPSSLNYNQTPSRLTSSAIHFLNPLYPRSSTPSALPSPCLRRIPRSPVISLQNNQGPAIAKRANACTINMFHVEYSVFRVYTPIPKYVILGGSRELSRRASLARLHYLLGS